MASKKPARTRKSSRSATRAAGDHDALSLLKNDHAQVRKLFARFAKLKDEDEDEKAGLIEQACAALTVHATLEEELFYPALRGVIEDDGLLDEAQVEHAAAKQMIAQLQDGKLEGAMRDATFTVLGEYVNHHIEEEEGTMFKQIKRSDIDLDSLGEEMEARKHDLQAEQMPAMPAARGRGERARAAAH